jgi:hypothetical protein
MGLLSSRYFANERLEHGLLQIVEQSVFFKWQAGTWARGTEQSVTCKWTVVTSEICNWEVKTEAGGSFRYLHMGG